MAQPIALIPDGANVLLDANVLIYALSGTSKQSVDLLARCDREEVSGFTTVEVVNEVCHRMMVAEAFAKGVIRRPAAGALKGRHDAIAGLSSYWVQVSRLLNSNLLVLELTVARIARAQELRRAHGLLTTDATVLAAMIELGIDRLASNDGDFERISSIQIYQPTDIP